MSFGFCINVQALPIQKYLIFKKRFRITLHRPLRCGVWPWRNTGWTGGFSPCFAAEMNTGLQGTQAWSPCTDLGGVTHPSDLRVFICDHKGQTKAVHICPNLGVSQPLLLNKLSSCARGGIAHIVLQTQHVLPVPSLGIHTLHMENKGVGHMVPHYQCP